MSLLDDKNRDTELSALLDFSDTSNRPAAVANIPGPERPGLVERATAAITIFTLMHGLPTDWLVTKEARIASEGNLKLVIAQLFLMGLGIARVAGWFNWLIRVFQLDLSVLCLAVLAISSTLWSDAPFETLKQSTVLVAVTVYAGYLVLRFALDEILSLVARVFVFSAFLNLFFVFALPAYSTDEIGAWDGVFPQKNALGFAAWISIPILIVVARSGRPWARLYYLAIPLQVTLLIGSQSKTMLVGTVGSVLVLFVSRAFRGRRTAKGAVVVALVVLSVTMAAVATANLAVLADWLDKDVTLTGRVPLWQALIPVAMERPVLGWGYKAVFRGYFSPVHEVWLTQTWEPSSAHNAFVHAFLEMGIVGLSLYVFSIGRVTARAVNVASSAANAVGLWPLAYLSAVLLLSITESGIVNSIEVWLFFPIAAYTCALQTQRPAGQ